MGEVGLEFVLSSTSLPGYGFLPSSALRPLYALHLHARVMLLEYKLSQRNAAELGPAFPPAARPHTAEPASQTPRVAHFAQLSHLQWGNPKVESAGLKLKAARQAQRCLCDCYTPSLAGKKIPNCRAWPNGKWFRLSARGRNLFRKSLERR